MQRGNSFLAGADAAAVAQRMVQPLGEQAAAHIAGAAVEHRKQRRLFFATERGGDFEIAAGGGVHADVLRFGFQRQAV